jgi:Protein of unknown function (DUF3662)/FHA domain
MGVFDRMEKGIERAVNGAFAKAFRSEVQPVEIASALRREVDDKATIVSRDRTLVPNTFVVELGQADHGRLGEWEEALGEELRDVVTEHAGQQQYTFVGPVTVGFEEAEDLDTGLFRVRSTTTKARTRREARQAPQPPPRPQAPRSGPLQVTLDVEGRSHQVSAPVTVIGRGSEAEVIVDDAGVSRRHAEVHTDGEQVWVVDLGSTNGTFVDGERVGPQGAPLADGSRITVGRTRVVVRFGSW